MESTLRRMSIVALMTGVSLLQVAADGAQQVQSGTPVAGVSAESLAEATNPMPMALVPIPLQTLTISHLFSGEHVAFPFDRLSPIVRRQLATCVPAGPTVG